MISHKLTSRHPLVKFINDSIELDERSPPLVVENYGGDYYVCRRDPATNAVTIVAGTPSFATRSAAVDFKAKAMDVAFKSRQAKFGRNSRRAQ